MVLVEHSEPWQGGKWASGLSLLERCSMYSALKHFPIKASIKKYYLVLSMSLCKTRSILGCTPPCSTLIQENDAELFHLAN